MRVALGFLPLLLLVLAFSCGLALGRARNQRRKHAANGDRSPVSSNSHGAGLYPGQRPRAPGKWRFLTGAKR